VEVLISSGTTLVGTPLDDNERLIDDAYLRFSSREQCTSERDREKEGERKKKNIEKESKESLFL